MCHTHIFACTINTVGVAWAWSTLSELSISKGVWIIEDGLHYHSLQHFR